MSLKSLAELQPGDLLPTGLTPSTQMEVLIADQRRYIGVPGRAGRQLAVRVVDEVKPEPDDVIESTREAAFTFQ